MIPLTHLTILKKTHWTKAWFPPALEQKLWTLGLMLLLGLCSQTIFAQQYCPPPAFLPTLTADAPLGTVICESEDVPLAVTVEGGFPLMGTGYAIAVNRLFQFDLSDPYGSATQIGGTFTGFFFTGGDLIDGTYYVLDFFNNGLYTIDLTTGVLSTQIGTTTPQVGETWSGLAWDPSTQMAYALSRSAGNSTLYSLDYTNGAVTVIGSTGISDADWLAIDNDGNAFAANANTFYSIDLTTGAGTSVGPTVINSNSNAQGADFDPATGLLFSFAHQQGTNNRLFNLVDPLTGEYHDLAQQAPVLQYVFTAVAIPGDQSALYNYAWSTGETTEEIIVNTTGTYLVSVTDHCGTEVVETITVSQDAQNTSSSCNEFINTGLGLDGTATLNPETVLEGENGCLEGYTVEIGTTGSNIADCSMIGQTFDVAVFDADGDMVCWGEGWTFDDKVDPVLECTDLTLSCTDDTDPATMADTGVTAMDNCTAEPTLTYTEVADLGCDPAGGFGSITRTWTATDEYGNTSSCTQTLTITRPSLDDLMCPENYDGMTNPAFECNGTWTQDDNGHPAPSVTGEPTLNNTTLDNVCMFDRTYSDQVFPSCGDAFDIVRTWTVIDWCNSQIETCSQTIKIMDNTPPTITCPANVTDGAGNNCNASVILDPPTTLSDNCSPNGLDYVITHTAGTLAQQGTNNVLVGLELGTSTVTYTATDECGNTSDCSFTITIIDDTAPPCVAITSTTLGISASGTTIPWTTFVDDNVDLTLADNCGPVTVEVKRQDMEFCDGDESTDYGLDVPFYCCDINNVVLIDVKVTDGVGLENFCTVEVTVQDNLDPTINCPADKMISCEGYQTALMTYDGVTPDADGIPDVGATSPLAYFLEENGPGTADDVTTFIGYYDNAADNCSVTVTITDGFLDVDDCGNSVNEAGDNAPFVRTYTATDDWDNTDVCTQEITIYNPNPFDIEADVTYPPTLVTTTCNDIGSLAIPTVGPTDNCELAGVATISTLVITPSGSDFCFKLQRTFGIYDWCNDDSAEPDSVFVQTVKVTDADAPVFADCTPTAASVEVGENFVFDISATDCTDAYAPTSGTAGVPVVTYEYEIDQGNDGSGADVSGTGTLSTEATGAGTDFPVGTHLVTFSATDYCGNVGTCSVLVTVTNTLDCDDFINPAVYEVNVGSNASGTTISAADPALYNQTVDATGVLISLTNNDPNPQPTINFDCSDITGNPVDVYFYLTTGEVCLQQILPVDISPPSLLSCGDNIQLQTNPVGGVITFDFDPNDPTDWVDAVDICSGTNLTYSLSETQHVCTSAADIGTQDVTIFMTDEYGNTSACVNFPVPYSCGATPPMNVVTGVIGNEQNGLLSNVTVSPASGMDVVTTDENGAFNMNLPTYDNYEITPFKDDDYLNGVSTYDIVLISKHLLGIEALDSPYKIIAADINKSGNVTTLDMVLLRKLVLFIDLEFSNNTSWRFVDANYVFDDPIEPLDEVFPETYPINELVSDMQDIDFVAVKTGDVNGTAIVNLDDSADGRTFDDELQLSIDEQLLRAGATYKIDVKAKDFTDVLGYQFTLGFEQSAIEVVDVVPGRLPNLDVNNFNLGGVGEGVITSSWNQVEAIDLEDNAILFTLEVNAKQDVKLSDVLNVNSRWTTAEAYRDAGTGVDLMNVSFEYVQPENALEISNVFELYQNRPNPFKNETLITFSLPETTEATLKIFDLSGKVIKEIVKTFDKGYNELSINRSDLNASGVLYYELSTSEHTALQKMIVID